jgi:hypothetical protein
MRPPAPNPEDTDIVVTQGHLNQMFVNTLFLRNAAGDDWYEFVKTLDPTVTYVACSTDGEVRSAVNDPTLLVPQNFEVFQLDTYVADLNSLYFRQIGEL